MMGGQSNSQTVTKYTQIQSQTSARGMCIPCGWGVNRWSTNLIWYNDFNANPVNKGGKGGGKGSDSYSYTAAIILALGEGPISGIGTIWVDTSTSTLGSLNLGLSYGGENQTPPDYITDNYPNQALDYPFTAYLFSALYSLGESASLPNHNFEVYSKFAFSMPPGGNPDANLGDIIPDMIQNEQYGIDPGSDWLDAASLSNFKTYQQAQGIFVSPYCSRQEQTTSLLQRWLQIGNSWGFWSGDVFKFVPLGDAPLTNHDATYVPNTSPIFDFTYDDFQFDKENTLVCNRIDPYDGYNRVEIDINDRSQYYNSNPIYWEDQTSVDTYGQLQSQTISGSELCQNNVGAIVAQLIGKRSVYIRNNFKAKINLGVGDLLEPGDIVTLTSPDMGLNRFPVRITSIEEDEDLTLTMNFEEFPYGIGTATLFPPENNDGQGLPNLYADPGNVNPPLIFEAPLSLTGGVSEIWTGASGGPTWGGAQVWVSNDNTNYVQLGTIRGPTQQGVLTTTLPSHSDPDTVDTLALNMAESGQVISTAVTEQMANQFITASMIDDELISYGSVALTGTDQYALTYLRRGIYNTEIAGHTTGAQWWGINPAVVCTLNNAQEYVGQTIYFKFLSFNTFGNELQSLADATAYPYTVTGNQAYQIDPPTYCDLVAVQYAMGGPIYMVSSWGPSPGPNLGSYEVQFSADGGGSWTQDYRTGASGSQYQIAALPSVNYQSRVRAISQSGQATSSWVTSAVVNSNSYGSPPPAPSSLTATSGGSFQVVLDIGASAGATGYPIFRAPGLGSPIADASIIGTASSTTYTDTTTGPGESLTYYAEAENDYGASGPSEAATITTETVTILTSGGTILTSGGNILISM